MYVVMRKVSQTPGIIISILIYVSKNIYVIFNIIFSNDKRVIFSILI